MNNTVECFDRFQTRDDMTPRWAARGLGDLVPCALHRNVETHLRCLSCGTPICPKCLSHTEMGALCPRCARRRSGGIARAPSVLRVALGAMVGTTLGALGGAILTLIPFGALLVLPLLALGLLTGEVIAAVAGRPGGLFIAMVGLSCGLLAPFAGRALAVSVLSGLAAGGLGLTASAESVSGLGLFLILASAGIAGVRAGTSRG